MHKTVREFLSRRQPGRNVPSFTKSFGLALATKFATYCAPYGFTEKTPQG